MRRIEQYQCRYILKSFFIGICLCFFMSACASEDGNILEGIDEETVSGDIDEDTISDEEALERTLAGMSSDVSNAYFRNTPLPKGRSSLRVLAIGNSYTKDALYYVPNLLSEAGYDKNSFSVYYAAMSAASLQQWYEKAQSELPIEIQYKAGMRMPKENAPLTELIAQDWDVITFQQYSELSINYDSFNPWLDKLIDLVRTYCPNSNVTLGWQMAWSYSDVSQPSMSNYRRWLLIAIATKTMMVNDGIDLILPIGTAIQNARNTALNSESQLTRDGWHLDDAGRYVAACTWLQTLFGPVYGWSTLNIPDVRETGENVFEPTLPDWQKEEYWAISHRCAVGAVEKPFVVVKSDKSK